MPDLLPPNSLFICYRRFDSEETVDRMYADLCEALGREAIFRDIDSIPRGVDFPTFIEQKLRGCPVVLVIIGRDWATVVDEQGRPRLFDPADHVRVEVETALALPDTRVIPVLVRRASMPAEEHLPESLRPLRRRNGIPIRPSGLDYRQDVAQLIGDLTDSVRTVLAQRNVPLASEASLPHPARATVAPTAPRVAPKRTEAAVPSAGPGGASGMRWFWRLLGAGMAGLVFWRGVESNWHPPTLLLWLLVPGLLWYWSHLRSRAMDRRRQHLFFAVAAVVAVAVLGLWQTDGLAVLMRQVAYRGAPATKPNFFGKIERAAVLAFAPHGRALAYYQDWPAREVLLSQESGVGTYAVQSFRQEAAPVSIAFAQDPQRFLIVPSTGPVQLCSSRGGAPVLLGTGGPYTGAGFSGEREETALLISQSKESADYETWNVEATPPKKQSSMEYPFPARRVVRVGKRDFLLSAGGACEAPAIYFPPPPPRLGGNATGRVLSDGRWIYADAWNVHQFSIVVREHPESQAEFRYPVDGFYTMQQCVFSPNGRLYAYVDAFAPGWSHLAGPVVKIRETVGGRLLYLLPADDDTELIFHPKEEALGMTKKRKLTFFDLSREAEMAPNLPTAK